jgi:hypothetical protein
MRCPLPCLVALVALGACASPAPEYFGVAPQTVVIEGTEIHVWQRGDRAQAIRMGRVARGEHGAVMARMVAATETATGCAAIPGQTSGGSSVLNLRLAC